QAITQEKWAGTKFAHAITARRNPERVHVPMSTSSDRRNFLKLLTTSAASAAFPASIARALAIPAHHHRGTIEDIEHVVFMMQENRAFDHYFGTLRGVRGFGDPRAVKLPTGKSVFHQPDSTNPDGFVLPFHPDAANFGLKFLVDTPHGWNDTH